MDKLKKEAIFAVVLLGFVSYYINIFLANHIFFYAVYVSRKLDHRKYVGTDFHSAALENYDFSSSDLSHSDLDGGSFRYSKFIRANLSGSVLAWSDFSGADLRGAVLVQTEMDQTTFRKSDLRGCDLKGTQFVDAEIFDSDLRGANLSGINLNGCLYDKQTLWPPGFDPAKHGAKLTVPESDPTTPNHVGGFRLVPK